MKHLKDIFPLVAATCVFFLASYSPMLKQMNQNDSVENEIKSIPVEGVNSRSKKGIQNPILYGLFES